MDISIPVIDIIIMMIYYIDNDMSNENDQNSAQRTVLYTVIGVPP